MPDTDATATQQDASQPRIEEFTIEAKLNGSMSDLGKRLGKLPFYQVRTGDDEIDLVKVESRSINKRPFLFHIVKLRADQIEITYSLIPDSSSNLRKAEVLKSVASILSMVADSYTMNSAKFLQYVDSVLEGLISGLSQNYTTLYNRYDSLLTEYREIKRLNIELAASNRNLTIQSAQLTEDNKVLSEQLSALQKFSDASLMAMVEEWISTHGSSIDINEFAKTNSISPTRVEQILDKMVSQGYLEIKS